MKDRLFRTILFIASCLIILLTAGIVYGLISQSTGAFSEFGFFGFITSSEWDARNEQYGALPFIAGTMVTSVLALLFCIPFSLSVALFNGEYFRNKKLSIFVSSVVDLLAGIPSIVYGLWGFYALRPVLISIGVSDQGFGVLLASLVLAIMILPTVINISESALRAVPNEYRSSSLALGATKMQTIWHVILPSARSGITTAVVLGVGRAIGEAMAISLVSGSSVNMPLPFNAVRFLTTAIVSEMSYAADLHKQLLFTIGLVLFIFIMFINGVLTKILKSSSVRTAG